MRNLTWLTPSTDGRCRIELSADLEMVPMFVAWKYAVPYVTVVLVSTFYKGG